MENVFLYFVSIGAGVAFGLSLGAIPAIMAYRYMQKRGILSANQTKGRSRS